MEDLSGKKIGILGGSFDPIHNGHLAIAESAYREFLLDEVWFIPAGHSPNKNEAEMTEAKVRAEMTEIAVSDIPYFRISRMEVEAAETSYTYLTLTKLKEQYPKTCFYFIMGADSLDYFEQWYHPEIICQKAVLLVAIRDELDRAQILAKIEEIKNLFHAEIYPLSCPKIDIASREIRASIKAGETVTDKIPEKVYRYIKEHGLYQEKTKQ